MRKGIKKTQIRLKKERVKEQTKLVYAALKADKLTRRSICDATGIKAYELAELFRDDRDLYSAYSVRRRTLVDTAADNVQEIIDDKDHPNNFAASKFVLQTYKSDLDNILESQNSDELEIDVGAKTKHVRVVFGRSKKDE